MIQQGRIDRLPSFLPRSAGLVPHETDAEGQVLRGLALHPLLEEAADRGVAVLREDRLVVDFDDAQVDPRGDANIDAAADFQRQAGGAVVNGEGEWSGRGLHVSGRSIWRRELPRFTQITFHRGIVWGARFVPDGATVVYSASREEKPSELFLTRLDQNVSRPLNIADAHLLSTRPVTAEGVLGTLNDGVSLIAKRQFYPIAGGAPRPIAGLQPKERIARFDGKYV